MKHILILLLIFTFYSCSDNSVSPSDKTLIGTVDNISLSVNSIDTGVARYKELYFNSFNGTLEVSFDLETNIDSSKAHCFYFLTVQDSIENHSYLTKQVTYPVSSHYSHKINIDTAVKTYFFMIESGIGYTLTSEHLYLNLKNIKLFRSA